MEVGVNTETAMYVDPADAVEKFGIPLSAIDTIELVSAPNSASTDTIRLIIAKPAKKVVDFFKHEDFSDNFPDKIQNAQMVNVQVSHIPELIPLPATPITYVNTAVQLLESRPIMVTVNIQAAPATVNANTSPMDVSLTIPTEFLPDSSSSSNRDLNLLTHVGQDFMLLTATTNPENIPLPPSPLPSTEQHISDLIDLNTEITSLVLHLSSSVV